MTQAQEAFTQSTPDEGTPSSIQWKSPIIWIGAIALLVVAVLAMMTLFTQEAVSRELSAPAYSSNPELMVVHRNAELAAQRAEAEFLRANPELKLAQRKFNPMIVSQSDLVANPEIKAHLRFKEVYGK